MSRYIYFFIFIVPITSLWAKTDTDLEKNPPEPYSHETVKYITQDNLQYNTGEWTVMEKHRPLRKYHRFTWLQRNGNQYQNLGNNGTPMQLIGPSLPYSLLHSNSLWSVYDKYFLDVMYYDTKSPYISIDVVLSKMGSFVNDLIYTRNILKNWNIGLKVRNIMTDRDWVNIKKGDWQVKSIGIGLFTSFTTPEKRYTLLADAMIMQHECIDRGGVCLSEHKKKELKELGDQAPKGDKLLYWENIKFLENRFTTFSNPNDHYNNKERTDYSHTARDMRKRGHLYHQVVLDECWDLYHDFVVQENGIYQSAWDKAENENEIYQLIWGKKKKEEPKDTERLQCMLNTLGLKYKQGNFFATGYFTRQDLWYRNEACNTKITEIHKRQNEDVKIQLDEMEAQSAQNSAQQQDLQKGQQDLQNEKQSLQEELRNLKNTQRNSGEEQKKLEKKLQQNSRNIRQNSQELQRSKNVQRGKKDFQKRIRELQQQQALELKDRELSQDILGLQVRHVLPRLGLQLQARAECLLPKHPCFQVTCAHKFGTIKATYLQNAAYSDSTLRKKFSQMTIRKVLHDEYDHNIYSKNPGFIKNYVGIIPESIAESLKATTALSKEYPRHIQLEIATSLESDLITFHPKFLWTWMSNYQFLLQESKEIDLQHSRVEKMPNTWEPVFCSATGPIHVLQIQLDLSLKLPKNMHWDTEFTINKVIGESKACLVLPSVLLNTQIYYKKQNETDDASIATGIDLHWRSSYHPDVYHWGIQKFCRQNTTKPEDRSQGYPILDYFCNFNIQRATVFIKFSHLNEMIPHYKSYFVTPGYPAQTYAVDIGVTWKFFN